MVPEALDKAILAVKAEGKVRFLIERKYVFSLQAPFFVNATSGSTVLGAYDDLGALAEVCARHGVWLHVDACWGGSAILSRCHTSTILLHMFLGSTNT